MADLTLYGILSWIVFGFVVGVIAKFILPFILPGKEPSGCVVTSVIGIVGTVAMQYITHQFFPGFLEAHHWIAAILGTMLILTIYHVIFGVAKR
jgi:uncharacterized membrane protein YeaQ/YmgE (transglycosylase-associated protein family)